jgi:LmbE family N-acetylglucosaminyl deacetylase
LKFSAAVVGLFAFSFLAASSTPAQFPPPPGTGPGLAETIEAIDSARVTTRILYITAHPDDESATLLTYLARGLHAQVALLTLTRGEGGQNDLGPEQAPQLGLIRTQELLAATRGYGIQLYFGGAQDFGFSKTTEETQKIWGDAVLGNMVRVIRTFRPDVIINGWGGVHGGHGHHQTSGIWTPRAVALAADPKAFPDQLLHEGLSVWGSSSNPLPILDTERGGVASASNGYTLPVDEISSLWGKSWREIALDAFSNHRSQGITGFLNSPFLRRPLVLVREDGGKLDSGILARPLHELGDGEGSKASFAPALRDAEVEIGKARDAVLSLNWEDAAKDMASVAKKIASISQTTARQTLSSGVQFELTASARLVERALALIAGVHTQAEADRDDLVAGELFGVTAESRCREHAECALGALHLVLPPEMSEADSKQDPGKAWQFKIRVDGPTPALTAWEQQQPEPPPLIFARQRVTVDGYAFNVDIPVTRISSNSTRINRVPLKIVPAYTISVEPNQKIETLATPQSPFEVLLRVHSYATQPARVSVGLDVPQGWTGAAPVSLDFPGLGDKYAKLTVHPPDKLATGNSKITAYVQRVGNSGSIQPGSEKFSTSLEPLPSMPTILWSEPAECRIHAFDVSVPENLRVGYITSEGEPVPEALQRLGIHVEMLDAAALNFSDLAKFDAIVVGVRAYELRPELPGANQRLLDYVSNGGTLVVQYQRDFAWDKFQFAPYPAKIDPGKPGAPLPRITDETSPVKFLKPDDPLLNRPNKITQNDFAGWVQERGLYFWSQFDDKYTPLLAMNDPGEPDLNGALVYTRYGKGTYIYTGIAFFRQLPEGVPGAYRLFVNLLSASRNR